MASVCTTEKEFAKAVKNNEDTIIVEGNLAKTVFRIKATGKVAWGVCAASLAVAITLCIVATPTTIAAPPAGAVAYAFSAPATAVAATTLGTAVVPAVLIGVSAGGIGVLTKLRDKYKIVEKTDRRITLKRKYTIYRKQGGILMNAQEAVVVLSAIQEIFPKAEKLSRVHGIVHNRVPAEMNGIKGFLVWDYVIWNEITFDDENGNIISFFNSVSDDKTAAMWNQLTNKYGIQEADIHVQEETEKDSL